MKPGVAAGLLALWLHAQAAAADGTASAGFDPHPDALVPLALSFTDETGKAVHLGDYFGGMPVILALAYYTCPNLCGTMLNGLVQSLGQIPFKAGLDYQVIVVSIDPDEVPATAAAKKTAVLRGGPADARGFHFLVGKQSAIAQLARAVGLRYERDASSGDYLHPAGIITLTPQGRISRYFYGVRYPARDLRLGLVEASGNRIGSVSDGLLLLCYHYDPNKGTYDGLVNNILRAAGITTALGLALSIALMARRGTR